MHIKEEKLPTLNKLSKFYVGISASVLLWFKTVGVRNLKENYNGLSANIPHQVVFYYNDNIVF